MYDAEAELHTYKSSQYLKIILETENYVQKMRLQVSELQLKIRDQEHELNDKNRENEELLSRLQNANYFAKMADDVNYQLNEKDEGMKHLTDKYENENLAIRQQMRVLQQDLQQKNQYLRVGSFFDEINYCKDLYGHCL